MLRAMTSPMERPPTLTTEVRERGTDLPTYVHPGARDRFEELQLTSLDAIDLVVELQQMTGRKVTETKLREVRTVGDIVTLVEAHLAASEAA